MKSIFLITFINLTVVASGQTHLAGKLQFGHSASGKEALLSSKIQAGGAIALSWHYGKKILGLSEFGVAYLQHDNPYLRGYNMRYFGFGLGYDVLPDPEKCSIYLIPQLGGFTMLPNENNPFYNQASRWRQSGIRVEANYFVNRWLGCSLTFSSFFPTHFGDRDYQRFLHAGLVFKTNRRAKSGEESNTIIQR